MRQPKIIQISGLINIQLIQISIFVRTQFEDADCMIDAAHDLGVLSADFCKLYHSDRKCKMSGLYKHILKNEY